MNIGSRSQTATKRVGKYDMALGEYLLTLAGKNNDPALASKLLIEIATLGTEGAQVTQAMSMLKRMTPEGKLMALQRIADRFNRESKGETAVKVPEEIIDRMQKANPGDTETTDQIFHDGLVSIAEQVPPTLLDKWNAWRYLAMLGNPRTHIRNITGNAVFTPVVYAKNILAGTIEAAVDSASKASGRQRDHAHQDGACRPALYKAAGVFRLRPAELSEKQGRAGQQRASEPLGRHPGQPRGVYLQAGETG